MEEENIKKGVMEKVEIKDKIVRGGRSMGKATFKVKGTACSIGFMSLDFFLKLLHLRR
jgi:hypothetical protein